MNLDENLKRNNKLMQNVADQLLTLNQKKEKEEHPQKGNGHVLEGIKKQLDDHYQNVSDGITLIVKTNRAAVTSPEFKNMDLKLGAILKSLNDSKREVGTVKNNSKRQFVVFGTDSTLTTKHFLIMVCLMFLAYSGVKYLPEQFVNYSEVKQERDHYKMFYRYHYLLFLKQKKDSALVNIEDKLNLIKEQDSTFYSDYNDMERWLQKEEDIRALKQQLKRIEL